jgi:FecR protein
MIEPDAELGPLLDAVIDGRCDVSDRRRFEELVRDDPRVRSAYLDQMRIHALLEWHNGRVSSHLDRVALRRTRWDVLGRHRRWLAAVLVIGAVLAARLGRGGEAIATLIDSQRVAWAEGQTPIAIGARIGPRSIRCLSGTLKLAFDSGAMVTLEGPVYLEVLSGMRIRAERGRIIARVEGAAKGFAIETSNTLVVDRGTEFGVEIDPAGQTGVVVFDGEVDLSGSRSAAGRPPIKRLVQGEAMRVDRAGSLSRIVAVERGPDDDDWSIGPSTDRDAVIRSVSDNIRGLDSSKYYQIVRRGLDEDAPAYVDRTHQWNGLDASGLPAFLRGADYIMTFNDGRSMKDLQITVDVAAAATLYIFFDGRHKAPAWLTDRFTDTGVKIGQDEGPWPNGQGARVVSRGPGASIDNAFSVWRRDLGRDESIRLGAQGIQAAQTMYGIAAVARP